jgi:hypothetical protein
MLNELDNGAVGLFEVVDVFTVTAEVGGNALEEVYAV